MTAAISIANNDDDENPYVLNLTGTGVVPTGTLTVTSPNGGENWNRGSVQTVTWTTTGSIANVRIEYSTNSGTDWSDVIASTPNNGSYSWTIPDTPSTTCLICISDVVIYPTNDYSNATFTISAAASTVTVTSPNGGETWAAGTTHDVTWTATGLTGTVTIDLYKGGVYQKTLGTADAATGSFSWAIATTETVGTDYRVLVWQGSVSDESDADFAIVRTVRVDFNKDGQEDLLWRYFGEGGYNRVWFLGTTEEGTMPLTQAGAAATINPMLTARAPRTRLSDPRDLGVVADRKDPAKTKEAEAVMGALSKPGAGAAGVDDPRKAGKRTAMFRPSPMGIADPRQMKLTVNAVAASDGSASIAAAKIFLGGADVMPVGDPNWEIVGTGDFDNDGNVDILWRNASSGTNVVWFMNGTDWSRSAEIMPVSDLSWKIVGTGDFNKDGSVDILWRNGVSGSNVIWYMNGAGWIGSAVLLGVSDPNWQIVGTGDFDKDGFVDILWRYNGAGGYNVVWYMNDAAWTGSAELIPVGDSAWRIMGTGDYNNDGNVDILWRYNGPGGYDYIWYMDGATWIGGADLMPVPDLNWKIVSR